MQIKEVTVAEQEALDLSQFKEMDYFAVENFNLPIELMMENAGLQLANLIAHTTQEMTSNILIGIGDGNNGGGGLVAARRLAAWGYEVYLDIFTDIKKELPKRQLHRTSEATLKSRQIKKGSFGDLSIFLNLLILRHHQISKKCKSHPK